MVLKCHSSGDINLTVTLKETEAKVCEFKYYV